MILVYFLYSIAFGAENSETVSCTDGQQWDIDTCTPRVCMNGVVVTKVVQCPGAAPCRDGRCCTECLEEAQIDSWIEENNLNQYGDAKDAVYAGGSPLFNEASGETLDRYDYIRRNHPNLPWGNSGGASSAGVTSAIAGAGRPTRGRRSYYPRPFMGCNSMFRKSQCLQHFPQCSWIWDEDMWVCEEAKEVESSKSFWAYKNGRDAGVLNPQSMSYGYNAIQNLFSNTPLDPEAYGDMIDAAQNMFPTGNIPMPSNNFDYNNIGGTGFDPMRYMPLNCDGIYRKNMCQAAHGCTWVFDDSMMRCKETKEIESYKQYWASQGAMGQVPPEMQASSGTRMAGPSGPARPQLPVGVGMAGVQPQWPRPGAGMSGNRPQRPVGVDMAGVPPMRPGAGMSGTRPQRPVGVDMAGVPPMRPQGPGMGFNLPLYMECETIRVAKRCYADPRCSWIIDDSMWVCQETKEVETSKGYWAVTNLHQGQMPGPIPGTHGWGGTSHHAPAQSQPVVVQPRLPATGNTPGTAAGATNPTISDTYGPGFSQAKLQKALEKAGTPAVVESHPSVWIYLCVSLISFMVGSGFVCLLRSKTAQQIRTRTIGPGKVSLKDEFVRLGEGRQV